MSRRWWTLRDLATICLSHIQPADPDLRGFQIVTAPAQIQRQALDLLGVSHRLGITWSAAISHHQETQANDDAHHQHGELRTSPRTPNQPPAT